MQSAEDSNPSCCRVLETRLQWTRDGMSVVGHHTCCWITAVCMKNRSSFVIVVRCRFSSHGVCLRNNVGSYEQNTHKQVRATSRPPHRSFVVPEDHTFSSEIVTAGALNNERSGIYAILVLPHRQLDSRTRSWVNKIRWRLFMIERHVTEPLSKSVGFCAFRGVAN